ncbi:MAG: hypothetical protein WCH65_03420 [bacterium]
MTYLTFFVIAILLNGLVALISLPLLKKMGRGLTVDTDVVSDIVY